MRGASTPSLHSIDLWPLITTWGPVESQPRCNSSLRGCQASSASRKAMRSPRAASQPALRAPPGPRFSARLTTRTNVGDCAASSRNTAGVSSTLPSSTRMTSSGFTVCDSTEPTARGSVLAQRQHGITTLTRDASAMHDAVHQRNECTGDRLGIEAAVALRRPAPFVARPADGIGDRADIERIEILGIAAGHLMQYRDI